MADAKFVRSTATTAGEVLRDLTPVLVEQLGVEAVEVTLEASLVEDLNADSLDLVEVIMGVEEVFGVEITDDDAKKIVTVQDAVDHLCDKLNIVLA